MNPSGSHPLVRSLREKAGIHSRPARHPKAKNRQIHAPHVLKAADNHAGAPGSGRKRDSSSFADLIQVRPLARGREQNCFSDDARSMSRRGIATCRRAFFHPFHQHTQPQPPGAMLSGRKTDPRPQVGTDAAVRVPRPIRRRKIDDSFPEVFVRPSGKESIGLIMTRVAFVQIRAEPTCPVQRATYSPTSGEDQSMDTGGIFSRLSRLRDRFDSF